MPIDHFINKLKRRNTRGVFNPWYAYSARTDHNKDAPEIRRQHLRAYLHQREKAPYLLVAEALGYQGGRFTGIPMTSERHLLGQLTDKGLTTELIFRDFKPSRTSAPSLRPMGFTEPTATIVWQTLQSLSSKNSKTKNTASRPSQTPFDLYQVVLWNAFPWHPYDIQKGLLSNRLPSQSEFAEGIKILDLLMSILEPSKVIALGNSAQSLLAKMGYQVPKVRHPARGGARDFRLQLAQEIAVK